MNRPKEYYKATKDNLINPCNFFSEISEDEILEYPNEIQLLIYEAQISDKTITGDYTINRINETISEIRNNQYNWIRNAIPCWKIKTWRLYKEYAKTWEAFCNKILGISHWMVNSWIRACEVIGKLIRAGFKQLPKNESQCRPLAKLEESELIYQWKEITEKTPEPKINRSIIEANLGIDPEEKATLRLPARLKNKLKAKAKQMGMTIEELLELLAKDEDPTDKPPTEPTPQPEKSDKCNQNNNNDKNITLTEVLENHTESFKEASPVTTPQKLKRGSTKKSKV